MAKDKDLDLDDMDEFDGMDDFDEESREPGTTSYSKKEIVQDAAEFGKRVAMKTSKKVLPDEYGAGLDEMVQYKDYVSEIATTSKNKLSKEVGRLNKEVKKILPGKLKGLSDKLDEFLGTNQDEGQAQAGQEEQRNAFIQSSISSIFDKQLQAQATLQADSEAKAEVSDKLNLVQTKKTQDILTEISNNTGQSVAFSAQIAKEYYRKSLEIQYRSYYVQADMLETMRNYYKTFSGQFDVISKNTALPEFVKLKQTERLKEFTRNKLMEEVYNRSLGKNGYVDNLKKNFGDFVNEKVQGVSDAISGATSGLGMLNEMSDAGMSTGGLVKDLAMDAGSDIASDSIAGRLKDRVGKNKTVQAGKGFMSSLVKSPEVFFNTFASRANKRLNKIDNASDNPVVSGITSTLSGMLDVFKPKGLDMNVENESVLTNKSPAIFDNNVYRSITDVIPMYLRKILKSSMDLTGMYSMTNSSSLKKFKANEELHFDYTNRRLDTLGNVKASIQAEMSELTSKNTIDKIVSTVAAVKKMDSKEAKSVRSYVEKASAVLGPDATSSENLFENYEQNEQLKSIVDKDPVLKNYIATMKGGGVLDKRGTQARRYTKAKSTIDYNLKQIGDKENVDFVKNLLNALLHHNGSNAEMAFTPEIVKAIIDSFKKYIVKDGGVLTADNLTDLKPFVYIDPKYRDVCIPLVNALGNKIHAISSDGSFADKSMLISALSDLHRAISDGDILNPELVKIVRDYNRDLVDVTKKNGRLTLDVANVTSLSIKDDDETISIDEFHVDKSVSNEGSTLDNLLSDAKQKLKLGVESVQQVTKRITTDVSKVRSGKDLLKLVKDYSKRVKEEGSKVFEKAKTDIGKNMTELEEFIKNTPEFQDAKKQATEFAGKIKTGITDKLTAASNKIEETVTQKESEIVHYNTLKAAVSTRADLSQTDKDKELKELGDKIQLIDYEIQALKKAADVIKKVPTIGGSITSYMQSLEVTIKEMKVAIDTELANLENSQNPTA